MPVKQKPRRPDGFALFPHDNGQWAKKIGGKLRYFGAWADSEGALLKYLDEKDDLQAGRVPRSRRDGLAVMGLCNDFLTHKQNRVKTGELSQRTFADYMRATDHLIDGFGKHTLVEDLRREDFERLRVRLSEGRGLVALGNLVRHCRIVLRHASEAELIERPIEFPKGFCEPSKRDKRRAEQRSRQQHGRRMFDAKQVWTILDAAAQPLRAMILLGINVGFGQSDCSYLPLSALDLKGGWCEFPRPKSAVERRAKLWPQTVAALREAIASRPDPQNPADGDLVFLTVNGRRWVRVRPKIVEGVERYTVMTWCPQSSPSCWNPSS